MSRRGSESLKQKQNKFKPILFENEDYKPTNK